MSLAKPPAPRTATKEDAARYAIPVGYSLKHWDPTEKPIMILGSVFDANSLGKWIYDWAAYHWKPQSPLTEVAGELWLLLIQLSGKNRRAEESISRVEKSEDKDIIEEFIDSGERLWTKLIRLIKECEKAMIREHKRELRAASHNDGKKESTHNFGANTGVAFVVHLLSRDKSLEKTEKLMTSMRLFNMRFDANCEDIFLQSQKCRLKGI